ncbi:hypothetical protein [Caenimonas sp. SL110]|uniref:hypothetical protein n=1 Tax=Caenimonas sp. SL110 TaxID=1450524 RepID=UPI00128C1A10|nr:hypothetical protein [Caenimonas sp. SL110]
MTLLDFVDRPTTQLLTYELRRLLRFPVPLQLWANGALAQAVKVGNSEAIHFYMAFVADSDKLAEGDKQRLLCGRSRFDQGTSLLHQAARGFGTGRPLTREQTFSAGIYLSKLLSLPMLESFKLDVIGELSVYDNLGLQTSARAAMLRGDLGLVTTMMCAILDARSTAQERAERLEVLGVRPDALLEALQGSGDFPGSLMTLKSLLGEPGHRAIDAPAHPAPWTARVSARAAAFVAGARRTSAQAR